MRFVSKNEVSDDFTNNLAEKVSSKINDEKFRREYLRVNLHEFDIRREAKEEGIALGISKGISKGLEKGARDAKFDAAQNALTLGLSAEQASKITGLTLQEIENLKLQPVKSNE